MKQNLLLKDKTIYQNSLFQKVRPILICGLTLCLTFTVRPAQAQLTKIWEVADIKHSTTEKSVSVQQKVDQAGNLIILSGGLTLFKYDATGNRIWSTQHNVSADISYVRSVGLWLDKSDNMYVLGQLGTSYDVYEEVLVKYGPAGNLLWSKIFENTAGNMVRIESLTLDSNGDVYLTGYMNDAGTSVMATQKISHAGTVQWTSKETGLDSGETIEVDNKGGVFVLTSSASIVTGSESVVLFKYDAATGTKQMEKAFHTPRVPGYNETGERLFISKTGEIYAIVGTSGSMGQVLKIFIYKIAADGTLIYKNQIGQTDAAVLYDVIFTSNEEFLFLCREQKYRTTWDHFITKVDANGQHVWLHKFNVYEADNMVRYFAPARTGMSLNVDGSIAIAGSYSYFKIPHFSASTVYTEYPKFILATFTKDGKETWRQVLDHFSDRDGLTGVSFMNTKSLYLITNPVESAGSYTSVNPVAMKYTNCVGLQANAGLDKEICLGESVQLQASNGVTYSWSPAAGLSATNIANPIANPTATTTYKVTVTNADGCTATDEVIVKVNTAPVATVTAGGATTFCEGGSVTLTATEGTGYSYQWLKDGNIITQATNRTYNAKASGNYSVVVKNSSGCSTTSATIKVTVNTPFTVSAGVNQQVCASAQAFALTGFSPAGGTWSGKGVSTDGTFNPTTAGAGQHTLTYNVTQNSCTVSSTKTITVMQVVAAPGSISGNTTVCNGTSGHTYSVEEVAGASSYSWSVPPGFTITDGQGTKTIKVKAGNNSGQVTVKAENNCGSSQAAVLSVNVSNMAAATITAGGSTTFCQGASVTLNAPAGNNYSYQWLHNGADITGATAATYQATNSGNYAVRVSNGSCNATSDAITVTANPGITNNNLTAVSQQACTGSTASNIQGSVPAGGNGGFTYQWERSTDGNNYSYIQNATGQNYNPGNLNETTWFRRKITAGGCASTSAPLKITVNTSPTVSLTAFASMCTDSGPLTLTGGQPTGGIYSGAGVANGIFNPETAGQGTHTITYSYTNNSGCTATATQPIVVAGKCQVTGIEDEEPPYRFMLFPNPTANKLQLEVEIPNRTDVLLQLADARGRVIVEKNYVGQAGDFKEVLQLGNTARGMYILRFTTKDGTYSRKVILW